MKGFLQEYGIIMVVVAVVLGMLAFGKMGYAKSIQNAILGSADHIVETGENITKKEVHVTAGDTLDIEGTKYVVLEERENSQAFVMTANNIGTRKFQSASGSGADIKRPDGQSISTYEGSEIDNYLENEWYNGLSSTMKAAIQSTNIKQVSYAIGGIGVQETGPNGQVYNTISRHVFLPSVSEIKKVVDYKNPDKINAFLNGAWIWTRDSSIGYHNAVMVLKPYGYGFDEYFTDYSPGFDVCPTFVIDLSKIDYKVIGHTDYK